MRKNKSRRSFSKISVTNNQGFKVRIRLHFLNSIESYGVERAIFNAALDNGHFDKFFARADDYYAEIGGSKDDGGHRRYSEVTILDDSEDDMTWVMFDDYCPGCREINCYIGFSEASDVNFISLVPMPERVENLN